MNIAKPFNFEITPLSLIDAETGVELKVRILNGGLNKAEAEVMHHLVEAWNIASTLGLQKGELDDFARGIHLCQMVLGQRVLGTLMPSYWAGVKEDLPDVEIRKVRNEEIK